MNNSERLYDGNALDIMCKLSVEEAKLEFLEDLIHLRDSIVSSILYGSPDINTISKKLSNKIMVERDLIHAELAQLRARQREYNGRE